MFLNFFVNTKAFGLLTVNFYVKTSQNNKKAAISKSDLGRFFLDGLTETRNYTKLNKMSQLSCVGSKEKCVNKCIRKIYGKRRNSRKNTVYLRFVFT